MKGYQKIDGGVLKSAREYDIAAATAITEGQLVKLTEGLVVATVAAETSAILGIAAESHPGTADALDPRANGKKIMVWDDPDLVMQCAPPEVTAASGSATTLVVTALQAFSNDDFNGGYVKLVSKVDESTNTDAVGTIRRITDFAVTANTSGTLTLESGGTPNAGDVYAVFPPIGFAKGNLNASRTGVVLTASASLPIKVAGHDRELDKINYIAGKHMLSVNA